MDVVQAVRQARDADVLRRGVVFVSHKYAECCNTNRCHDIGRLALVCDKAPSQDHEN